MPQVVLGEINNIDGSVQRKVFAFLQKLMQSHESAGLHIEPMVNSVDPRARTGRIDSFWRAVLFEITDPDRDRLFVFVGAYAHDKAIEIARTRRLTINPRNGIAEISYASEPVVAEPAPTVHSAAAAPLHPRTLRSRGFSDVDLTDLGMDAVFVAGAMDLGDEDDILAYAQTAPATWQGEALVDLATGTALSDVQERYALHLARPSEGTEDERLIAALKHPAARMQFAFVEDNDELRAAVEAADFAAWRVFLHPEQRVWVEKGQTGPFRLTGGAGTGKTVVLLHRARFLARRDPTARIVLTTFNRTLADSLVEQMKLLDPTLTLAGDVGQPGVFIASVDSIAARILHRHKTDLEGSSAHPGPVARVFGPRTSGLFGRRVDDAWKRAIVVGGVDLPPELSVPSFFETEYSLVVLPNRIVDRDEYLRVRRAGRGVSLNRARRNAVWDVVESYRSAAAAAGCADFEEKAALAAEVVTAVTEGLADHVIVDEAQDLTPSRFQLLRALAPLGPDDLFFAEDAHQRIYGQKIVLKQLGINIVGRSRRLTLNYRTTQQNLHYALSVLTGDDFVGLEGDSEDSEGYRSARTGPKPSTVQAANLSDLYDKVAQQVLAWGGGETASIGLLAPANKEASALPRALGERGVTATFVDNTSKSSSGGVQAMTMYRAKGMEFANVILVGVSANAMPRDYMIAQLPEGDRGDALQRERSLVYVAATRARDQLAVMWVGERSALVPS
ncbi:3'-5' exonuclease [Rhodococcus sp. UNC23MFCrub1.1]|uniref:3'-5' exonuclease n=1 Tax=Rhodococcus sp. UNC23MFCrub1.1 TaxID=1449068 RepID=UPI00047F30FF|nr:3'-5' exonuclease [Rhodococcus sp. UNC23MFCrub1.1]